MKQIDSPKNELVKKWKKLHTKKGRDQSGQFLIEGYHLVEEALKSTITIETILVTESVTLPTAWHVDERDVILVSDRVMADLTETKTPQGIAAICHIPDEPSFQELEGMFLCIDHVQDPGNVGTMIRTCDAAGMSAVIVSEGSVDIYNSKVVRASQGSIFHLPVIKGDLHGWVDQFKEAGIPVFGTALEGGSTYTAIEPQARFALLVGNEGEGVEPELLDKADQNLYIPLYGKAESLNVAVATGILLYYLRD
ncbi:RNA methyltransferase [Halalkalibacterium halodurans]|uniref:rRNA methylase n=2 Tax=Halalkalibacterium halodurans TaxID=86665 RepID=Q9K894_HALH5|nr:RNA methyltransferase [Halalkalibacterium halodurans]MED4082095.1 RNA methyltransferase [Halalkalibacterium halodurans]MED4084327.1 RNA methyltransferase [Halalkalibacterium halodurans]MED4103636.1 RNA methyltransferase [Halalkalibacterium halodurans]MED4107603.1 RNA methyltransferase [Halalkalibacterium halodurans]MED4126024.1 RNA methyltransferase [Halalkalibacterium halodurans]